MLGFLFESQEQKNVWTEQEEENKLQKKNTFYVAVTLHFQIKNTLFIIFNKKCG